MQYRRAELAYAWRELGRSLRRFVATGARLARCRLTGGHEMGTWRFEALVASAYQTDTGYVHVWCRRCGWCEMAQSFDEEDAWGDEPPLTEALQRGANAMAIEQKRSAGPTP